MHTLHLQSHRGRRTAEYSSGMWRIGLGVLLTPVLWSDLGINVGYTPTSAIKFWRLELNKTLYYSTEYTRASSTNNFTVAYQDESGAEKYGIIKFFLELLSNPHSRHHIIAVIEELTTVAYVVQSVIVPQLQVVTSRQQSFIDASTITLKCVLLNIGGETIIARPFDFCHLSV